MHFRMVPPKDVEEEGERLFKIWSALPDDECGEWFDFLKKNCSEAAKAYMRECEEVYSQLKPGEYV